MARVKRWGKSPPASWRHGGSPNPVRCKTNRLRYEVARPGAGSLPRGMVTLDRIRLTGLLRKAPASAGVFYVCMRHRRVTRSTPRSTVSRSCRALRPQCRAVQTCEASESSRCLALKVTNTIACPSTSPCRLEGAEIVVLAFCLETFGVEFPPSTVWAQRVSRTRPAPAARRAATECLQFSPAKDSAEVERQIMKNMQAMQAG
jgi:hypothetical protein